VFQNKTALHCGGQLTCDSSNLLSPRSVAWRRRGLSRCGRRSLLCRCWTSPRTDIARTGGRRSRARCGWLMLPDARYRTVDVRWFAMMMCYPARMVITVVVIAAMFLCLSRRNVAIAPAFLLALLPSRRPVVAIMVAVPASVADMRIMVPMLARLDPLVPFPSSVVIVIFSKCRAAHQHARNHRRPSYQSLHMIWPPSYSRQSRCNCVTQPPITSNLPSIRHLQRLSRSGRNSDWGSFTWEGKNGELLKGT
jgi:hypothetical protein